MIVKWWIVQTWKAEEAVPNMNPFGKLVLFISDVHIWISSNAIIANIIKVPPLNSMVREWTREKETKDWVLQNK